MDATITVEARVAGQRRPLVSLRALALAAGEERLRLRALIARIVREEVAGYAERQERRRLVQALTEAELARAVTRGKVDMGGERLEEAAAADPEAAVAAALQAFADGLYFVFVDDVQHTELDAEVSLRPGSRLTFLRLVALAGG
jgi:hypothetical protein